VPIRVQRTEREAAREPDYTIAEWVEFEGAAYEELDGPAEIAEDVRVLPTPGHTPGHQSVLVDGDGKPPSQLPHPVAGRHSRGVRRGGGAVVDAVP